MQVSAKSFLYNNVDKVCGLRPNIPIVILSPHLDDAAWSLGAILKQLSEAGHALYIINIFSISPAIYGRMITPAEATTVRVKEDRAVYKILGCKVTNLDFPDGLLRDRSLEDVFDARYVAPSYLSDAIARSVQEHITPDAIVLAPSGFGMHIDHLTTRRVAERLTNKVIFYEDFPYATRTVRIAEALNFLQGRGLTEFRFTVTREVIDEHIRIYNLYTSQRADHHVEQIRTYLLAHGFGLWMMS